MGRCSQIYLLSHVHGHGAAVVDMFWRVPKIRRRQTDESCSMVGIFALPRRTDGLLFTLSPGQYLSAVSQDGEVQMLPHIHKMISSNLPPSYHTTIHSLGLIVPSSVRIVTKTPDRVDSPASQRTQRLILLRERVDC